MKRRKRLLALALAGVLAGQMGVVAWGTGADASAAAAIEACKAKGHGSLERVTAACSGSNTHWLKSGTDKQMSGGAGTNYYFVQPGDMVTCSVGNGDKNIIVVDPNLFSNQNPSVTSFTLLDFKANVNSGDKIYLLGAEIPEQVYEGNDNDNKYYSILIGSVYLKIAFPKKSNTAIPAITTNDFATKTGSELVGLTLKLDNKKITSPATIAKGQHTITAEPAGIGKTSYSWEIKNGATGSTLKGASCQLNIPDNTPVGTEYQIKCTATDELGCIATAETTVTVSGCDKSVVLGDISGLPTSPVYSPKENETLNIACSITEDQGGKCIDAHNGDTTHGHTVAWSVSSPCPGIELVSENGMDKLRVTVASLPDNETPFTITAKLDGKDEQYKTATFVAKKYVEPFCAVTPNPEITGEASINEDSGSTVRYTLDWRFDKAKCTISHTGSNHDYIVTGWNFKQDKPDYVTDIDSSNSTGEAILHIDPQKLPATEQTLTLTATFVKEEPALLTNDVDTTPTPREVTKIITFKGKAAAPTDTCNAALESITIKNGSDKVSLAADEIEKTVELAFNWTENNCSNQHANPATHDRIITCTSDNTLWAPVKQENGKWMLTIKKDDIPNATGNKVTITATINDATPTTITKDILVERPPRCYYKITKINQITGQPHIYVEQGREAIEVYTLEEKNLEYEKGGTCEFDKNVKHTHGESATWKISGTITNNKRMEDDKAITMTSDGKLVVNGSKLQEGNTYAVPIEATAGNAKLERTVEIHCTTPDDDDDDSDHWESYEDKIEDAKRGSTVKMDLTGNGEVPFYVFESARGRDVTLQMKAGKNYTWTINGKAMKKWPAGQIYLPLEVETLKDKTLTRLCRDNDVRTFKLRHEGSFYGDMKLTVDVGVGNAKKTMYLYSYNEDKERLTYQSCALADNDGDVTFVMTRSLGAYAVTSKALYGEKPVSGGGGLVNGSGSGPTTVYPPVAPSVPSSSQSPSSSSSSSSGSESSSQSEPALPPEPPASSREPAAPTDTDTKPKDSIPVLVPVLILAIAGVITATVLVVRSSRGRLDDFDD